MIYPYPQNAKQGDITCDEEYRVAVFDGTTWISVNNADLQWVRNQEISSVHEQYPQLKELWDEYCVMKKLLTGK